jgi:hypothetical protein
LRGVCRDSEAAFGDYSIGELRREDGCRDTVTLYRALRGAPGYTLLG